MEESKIEQIKAEHMVMSYRFDTLEDKLSSLEGKIDQLLVQIIQQSKEHAIVKEKLARAEAETSHFKKRLDKMEQEVITVRVSLAKIISFGAAGGGLAAGLLEILKLAMK